MARITGYEAVTVHTTDMERARVFYQSVLGLKELEYDAGSGKAMFAIPDGPPLGVHVWNSWCKDEGGRPPGTVTGIILTAADPGAVAAEVASGGGSVTGPVEPREWTGGRPAGFIADPDGNEFILAAAPQ